MTVMKRTTVIDGEWVVLPLIYNSNSETSAHFEIPLGGVIYPWDAFLLVDTIDATETIDVGILSTESGGDANGFISGYSIATAGRFCVANMITATDGSNQNYISANYIGALFYNGLDGGNAAGTAGVPIMGPHVGDGVAKTISYTCSAGSDTFKGRLVFKVYHLPL